MPSCVSDYYLYTVSNRQGLLQLLLLFNTATTQSTQ